jgi:hypothetical protein
MAMKRHIGRLKNTDRRCVVVFMQIPNREDHALIIDTDALPDRHHDSLMEVVDSHAGQQTPVLANILTRRILPDTGMDIMQAMHNMGYLQAVPVTNVVMYPEPNHPMALEAIIKLQSQTAVEARADVDANRASRITENQEFDKNNQADAVAMSLILQARDLQTEAHRKFEQAYDLAPHLAPKTSTPSPQEVVAALRQDEVVPEVFPVAGDEVNLQDLPEDVMAAYLEASKEIHTLPILVENETLSEMDAATQAFLDRAAYRADQEINKKPVEAKKPATRARKKS